MRAAELRADRGCSRGLRQKVTGVVNHYRAQLGAFDLAVLRRAAASGLLAGVVRLGLWRGDLDGCDETQPAGPTTAAVRRRLRGPGRRMNQGLSCARRPVDPCNLECPCRRRLSTPTQSLGRSHGYRPEKMRCGLFASGAGAQPCRRHDTRHPAHHRRRHAPGHCDTHNFVLATSTPTTCPTAGSERPVRYRTVGREDSTQSSNEADRALALKFPTSREDG
jgi:hypothetical protein